MNDQIPKVSIGLPVFNGEKFLERALDSLLKQTFSNIEIIISDNASTDRTEAICRRYSSRNQRIRYFRNTRNIGAAKNFNKVFRASRGEYFQWLAHDDYVAPDFIEKSVLILEKDTSVVVVFAKTNFVDEKGNTLKVYSCPFRFRSQKVHERFFDFISGNHVVVEAFGLIRSSALRNTFLIGAYVGSDRVLLGQLALIGYFFEIPEALFFHGEHSERSTKAFPEIYARTYWFDPLQARRVVLPRWRCLLENFKSVSLSSVSIREKTLCFAQLTRMAKRQWHGLTADLWMAVQKVNSRF